MHVLPTQIQSVCVQNVPSTEVMLMLLFNLAFAGFYYLVFCFLLLGRPICPLLRQVFFIVNATVILCNILHQYCTPCSLAIKWHLGKLYMQSCRFTQQQINLSSSSPNNNNNVNGG